MDKIFYTKKIVVMAMTYKNVDQKKRVLQTRREEHMNNIRSEANKQNSHTTHN